LLHQNIYSKYRRNAQQKNIYKLLKIFQQILDTVEGMNDDCVKEKNDFFQKGQTRKFTVI